MSDLGFPQVRVSAQACRVVATLDEHYIVFPGHPAQPGVLNGGWVEAGTRTAVKFHRGGGRTERNRYPLVNLADRLDVWPGEGISYDLSSPTKWIVKAIAAGHRAGPPDLEPVPGPKNPEVRIRRLPLDAPLVGVVIGQVRRMEGKRDPGGTDRYGEPADGWLGVTRGIELQEIAIPQTGCAGLVFLAWRDDLEPA